MQTQGEQLQKDSFVEKSNDDGNDSFKTVLASSSTKRGRELISDKSPSPSGRKTPKVVVFSAMTLSAQNRPSTTNILTLHRPSCNKVIYLRPGNWVAKQLREINDRSNGHVIPMSAYSQRSYNKYQTLYDKDFPAIRNATLRKYWREQNDDMLEREHRENERETVGDVFGGRKVYSAREPFANWHIPERFLKEAEDKQARNTNKQESSQDSMRVNQSQKPGTLQRSKTMLPRIQQSPQSRSKNHIDSCAKSATPRYNSRTGDEKTETPKNRPRTADCISDSGTNFKPQVSRSIDFASSKTTRSNIEQWLQKLPKTDKETIEKFLAAVVQSSTHEPVLKKNFMEKSRERLTKWLTRANDKDRRVVARFLADVAGTNNLMLEKHKVASTKLPESHGEGGNTSALKFIRLLTPNTRKNRWMNTTWHHLPELTNDNPVFNASALYTRPRDPIPRQFVIHPEWG